MFHSGRQVESWPTRMLPLFLVLCWNTALNRLRRLTGTYTCLVKGGVDKMQFQWANLTFKHCRSTIIFSSFAPSLFLLCHCIWHPPSRQPQFDPAIFSVWCTIIHPSLYSLCPTLQSFCFSLYCLQLYHYHIPLPSMCFFLSLVHFFNLSLSSCCLHSLLCCFFLWASLPLCCRFALESLSPSPSPVCL